MHILPSSFFYPNNRHVKWVRLKAVDPILTAKLHGRKEFEPVSLPAPVQSCPVNGFILE